MSETPSLASIFVALRPKMLGAVASESVGQTLRSAGLEMVRQADPALASTVPDEAGLEPFTMSPLMGRFGRTHDGISLEGRKYRVRICSLTAPAFRAIVLTLGRMVAESGAITIGGIDFDVLSYGFSGYRGDPGLATYSGLLQAEPGRKLSLRFLSPTVFRTSTRGVAIPTAREIFGGYLNQWSRFAPEAAKIDAASAESAMSCAMMRRCSMSAGSPATKENGPGGLVGACTIESAWGTSQERLRILNALGRFAAFAGSGSGTALGMGQTAVRVF
jgi:hypothetical protein